MHESNNWKPPKSVVFGWLLCLLMLSGEIASGTKNPMSLVFYCFIPAVLWMIANDHKRKAKLMIDIKARVDQLEVSYRCE